MYLFEEINSPHVGELVKKGYVGISDHVFKKYQLFEVNLYGQRLELWLNKDFDDLNSVGFHATLYDSEENIVSEDDAALPVSTIIGLEMSSWSDARNAVDALNYGFIDGPLPFFGQIYQPISAPVMYFGAVTDSDSIDVMKDYLKDVSNINSTLVRDQYIECDDETLDLIKNDDIRNFLKEVFENKKGFNQNIFARNTDGIFPEFYLTGNRISTGMHECLKSLSDDNFVYHPDSFSKYISEFYMARERMTKNESLVLYENSDKREQLRDSIVSLIYNRGSYRNNVSYTSFDGPVSRTGRVDLVIGFQGSDLSSVSRSLSEKYYSHIIDGSYIQEELPEYDNGWGYNTVHGECKQIEDKIYEKCLTSHDNVVVAATDFTHPSDYDRICGFITKAKDSGYHVSLSYLSCDSRIALERNIQRFICGEERFIDPDKFMHDYYPADVDLAYKVYSRLIDTFPIDEYHRYENNMRLDEHSVPKESGIITAPRSDFVSDTTEHYGDAKLSDENLRVNSVRKFHR